MALVGVVRVFYLVFHIANICCSAWCTQPCCSNRVWRNGWISPPRKPCTHTRVCNRCQPCTRSWLQQPTKNSVYTRWHESTPYSEHMLVWVGLDGKRAYHHWPISYDFNCSTDERHCLFYHLDGTKVPFVLLPEINMTGSFALFTFGNKFMHDFSLFPIKLRMIFQQLFGNLWHFIFVEIWYIV